jgi:hypothetical protein
MSPPLRRPSRLIFFRGAGTIKGIGKSEPMSAQSNKSEGTRSRSIVSLIAQRSCIELFAAYGVAVAPVPQLPGRPVERPGDHLVGMVQVSAPNRRGIIQISASPATLVRMKPGTKDTRSQLDWMRELANQVSGRIKNKLTRYQLCIQVGLPTATTSTSTNGNQIMKDTDLLFVFHTLREKVLLGITGGFDDTGLVLQADAPPVTEGEILLF